MNNLKTSNLLQILVLILLLGGLFYFWNEESNKLELQNQAISAMASRFEEQSKKIEHNILKMEDNSSKNQQKIQEVEEKITYLQKEYSNSTLFDNDIIIKIIKEKVDDANLKITEEIHSVTGAAMKAIDTLEHRLTRLEQHYKEEDVLHNLNTDGKEHSNEHKGTSKEHPVEENKKAKEVKIDDFSEDAKW